MACEHDYSLEAVGTLYDRNGIYQRYIPNAACECGKTRPFTHDEQLTMMAEAEIVHDAHEGEKRV